MGIRRFDFPVDTHFVFYVFVFYVFVFYVFVFCVFVFYSFSLLLIYCVLCRHFLKLSQDKYNRKHTGNSICNRAGKHDTLDAKRKR